MSGGEGGLSVLGGGVLMWSYVFSSSSEENMKVDGLVLVEGLLGSVVIS